MGRVVQQIQCQHCPCQSTNFALIAIHAAFYHDIMLLVSSFLFSCHFPAAVWYSWLIISWSHSPTPPPALICLEAANEQAGEKWILFFDFSPMTLHPLVKDGQTMTQTRSVGPWRRLVLLSFRVSQLRGEIKGNAKWITQAINLYLIQDGLSEFHPLRPR